jgi:T-complex protein 1 subunit zeta
VCIVNAEILKCSERYLLEGVHPRVLVEGIKEGVQLALNKLETIKIKIDNNQSIIDGVIRSALLTKVSPSLAEKMTNITSEAVRIVKQEGKELGFFLVLLLILSCFFIY